jgi:hypothetical protein
MVAVSKRFNEGSWADKTSPLKEVLAPVLAEYGISKPGRPTRFAVGREMKLLELLTANGPQYDLDTISQTMRAIDDVIMHDSFCGLNRILKKLDLTVLEPIAVLTLLRTTKPYKHNLPEWHVMRDRAYKIVRRKGLPVDNLMRDL